MGQSEQEWIEKAKRTFEFHRSKLRVNDKWTIKSTATELKRAIGSVSEDILIARWLRTHENQLRKFSTAYEALAFIRDRQKKMDLEEAV
jgi:hypothetical protein